MALSLFSYSAYLWRQPILSFARHRMLGDLTDLWLLALSLLSLLFGYISWRWVETPFRNRSLTTKKFIFVFSAIGILVFSMLGVLIQSNDGFNEKVSEFARAIKPRGIIFSARWAYYNFGDYGGDSRGINYISSSENGPFNQLESMESFNIGLSNTVNFYRDINIPINIISQTPQQKYLPESVYYSSYKRRFDIEAMAAKRTEFDKMESFSKSAFLARADDINFHYMAELFCDDKNALLEQMR